MKRKPTDELLSALQTASSAEQYLKENNDYLINEGLTDCLESYLKEKHLSKADVLKRAEINEIYGYQIFSGKRMPSRDKLLCLAIGMQLSVEETQQLLKHSGFAPLYPKNKRDSIILFGIDKGESVCEINEVLYSQQEKTLD